MMPTEILSFSETFEAWEEYTKPDVVLGFDEIFVQSESVGLVGVRYQNKVWDTTAGAFVTWETDYQDFAGLEYPGPGTFGVDTSDYVVLTINHDRLQQP